MSFTQDPWAGLQQSVAANRSAVAGENNGAPELRQQRPHRAALRLIGCGVGRRNGNSVCSGWKKKRVVGGGWGALLI